MSDRYTDWRGRRPEGLALTARKLYLTDEYGLSVFGLMVSMAACFVALITACVVLNWVSGIAACDEQGGKFRAADATYFFWSGECWLTQKDGTEVPSNRYRATERVHTPLTEKNR